MKVSETPTQTTPPFPDDGWILTSLPIGNGEFRVYRVKKDVIGEGPTGPAGPIGLTGDTGPAGPIGPAGPAGAAVTAGRGLVLASDVLHFAQDSNYTTGLIPFATGTTTIGFDTALKWIAASDILEVRGSIQWMIGGAINASINDDGDALLNSILVTTSITANLIDVERVIITQTVLTYAASTAIDFDLTSFRTISLTGNITFTTSNLAAGKSVTLKILADGSTRTFTFPGWIFVGAGAPADISANKTAILTLTAFGAADANVVAAYAVQP
jgi:hypothetical protein